MSCEPMARYSIERIVPAPVPGDLMLSREDHNILHHEDNVRNSDDISTNDRIEQIYIAVRGDIIFPYNECHRLSKSSKTMLCDRIQQHLKAILEILRPQDTMKMAVRLESQLCSRRTRYLLVVTNQTDQSCLLGIDYENEATIGLVLPIWNDMQITLDGDGGFGITTGIRHHIFKPVSVQAMWSAFQALHLATKKSIKNNYYEGGGSHSWISYYHNSIKSNQFCLHEWHTVTDQTETNSKQLYEFENKPKEQHNFQELITSKLKQIMMSVDLEQVTSKEIRKELENHFQRDLTEYKSYIDTAMIRIMGQMEEASKIFDYLYLGSEWNASNLEELKGKGVKKILNVTYEIDNYFPGSFEYYNIRVDDDEDTDMLRHLNQTYYYIRKAKDEGVKVLVHCKKGISRSACVVVAYIMKEKSCDLNEALEFVKNQRSTIRPNPEFLKQLEIYEGMLHASKKTTPWRSSSETNLSSNLEKAKSKSCDDTSLNRKKVTRQGSEKGSLEDKENSFRFQRRRSWPPKRQDKGSSSIIVFGNKENQMTCDIHKCVPCCCLHNKDFDNLDTVKGLEIKSRVKERIEDFENKQPVTQTKNSTLFKKNIAKNGLVSNLACQFESKDKEALAGDLLVQDVFFKHQKPPLPSGTSKLSKEEQYEQLTNNFKSHSINLSRSFHATSSDRRKCEYSNLKRTLSFDHIYDISKNLDSTDAFRKKSKKSLTQNLDFRLEQRLQWPDGEAKLCRAVSLPNICMLSLNLKRRMHPNYSILLPNQPTHFKSPLDLHCFRIQLTRHLMEHEFDGFVKRRTEELESKHTGNQCQAEPVATSSSSVPSSPHLTEHHFSQRQPTQKAFSTTTQIKTSKSFNYPSTHKKSHSDNMSDCTSETSGRCVKKTYGKSHPLDKLNRFTTSTANSLRPAK